MKGSVLEEGNAAKENITHGVGVYIAMHKSWMSDFFVLLFRHLILLSNNPEPKSSHMIYLTINGFLADSPGPSLKYSHDIT